MYRVVFGFICMLVSPCFTEEEPEINSLKEALSVYRLAQQDEDVNPTDVLIIDVMHQFLQTLNKDSLIVVRWPVEDVPPKIKPYLAKKMLERNRKKDVEILRLLGVLSEADLQTNASTWKGNLGSFTVRLKENGFKLVKSRSLYIFQGLTAKGNVHTQLALYKFEGSGLILVGKPEKEGGPVVFRDFIVTEGGSMHKKLLSFFE